MWVSFFLRFGVGGRSCSNLLASTVIYDVPDLCAVLVGCILA